MSIDKIVNILKKEESFVILTHVSPDGDALGSSFALALALEKLGKKACVLLEDEIPKIYEFLPSIDLKCLKNGCVLDHDNEVVIALDSGDLSRLGCRKSILENADVSLNIDHHHTNTLYAKINYLDKTSSSTGEILFDIIKSLGDLIDYEIALSLYVAICTDTGNFKYKNTTKKTHQIAGELLEYGIDTENVARTVFDAMPIARIELMKLALESLELHSNGKIALMILDKDDFENSNATSEQAEGLVDLARNIENVQVAVFIRYRKEGKYRVNLRANSNHDVSIVASKFNGGGHKKASGCELDSPIEETKKVLINEIIELLG